MKLQQNKTIICLEGMVGSGKTTQIERLNDYFHPNSYLIPELNDISPMKEIRAELRETGRISNLTKNDVINIAKARAEIQGKLLNENEKSIILMDRGIYTGMVFESGNLSMWEVENISKNLGIVVPDVCFVLYCSTEKALERVDERRIKIGKYSNRAVHENEDYINKTKQRYFEIAKNRPVILINGSGTIDEVYNKLKREIHDAKIL